MSRKTKTIVAIADMHSGHVVGLTPSSWHDTPDETASESRKKLADLRKRLFHSYFAFTKEVKPDVLIVNGDCIDGRGERSGGTELLTTDRNRQCDMAVECIKCWKADRIAMTYGTAYHSGQLEDYEDTIAKEVGATIGAMAEVDINGCVFNCKHDISGGQTSTASDVALRHENRHNQDWSEAGQQSRAHVFVRSHQHRVKATWLSCSDGMSRWGVVTPALQALGSKFGARKCRALVHWGITVFHVTPAGNTSPVFLIPQEVYEWQQAKTIRA